MDLKGKEILKTEFYWLNETIGLETDLEVLRAELNVLFVDTFEVPSLPKIVNWRLGLWFYLLNYIFLVLVLSEVSSFLYLFTKKVFSFTSKVFVIFISPLLIISNPCLNGICFLSKDSPKLKLFYLLNTFSLLVLA